MTLCFHGMAHTSDKLWLCAIITYGVLVLLFVKVNYVRVGESTVIICSFSLLQKVSVYVCVDPVV